MAKKKWEISQNSNDDVQEEQQIQNMVYQWHQEEEQTNYDRQYTQTNKKQSNNCSAPFPPVTGSQCKYPCKHSL